jgi:hypothetical protein
MIKKIKAGAYEYTDGGENIWKVLNHGYTRGYACVMWVGITKDQKKENTSIVIWGYSKKDVIQRIEDR